MQRLTVKPGDLIVNRYKEGWSAIKILAVDPWPDGTFTAHCLNYKPLQSKPTVESLARSEVLGWHAPIDAGSFDTEGWELLGNRPPTKDELEGFVEYLKLTDFPRYLQVTGIDSKELVRKAKEHYLRANQLADQKKRLEAIAEYSKAVDLFPLFFEAIDNRGLTLMELGKFQEALHDFEQSLRVDPDGTAAFFSRGECLLRLRNLIAAEAVFAEGSVRFPEKKALFESFLKQTRARLAKR